MEVLNSMVPLSTPRYSPLSSSRLASSSVSMERVWMISRRIRLSVDSVVFVTVFFQQLDDGEADQGGLGGAILIVGIKTDVADVLSVDKLDDGSQIGAGKTDVGGGEVVAYEFSDDVGNGQIAETFGGFQE